ncbi:ComF family protein [Wolbachia endosymbiont of Pentidionis agamae]|uniref:ComF family protein n=1 Tax=Wolbachia endosymbiont of Pentidionis agamae TaxID=3110435 RepID=UPI0038CD15FF
MNVVFAKTCANCECVVHSYEDLCNKCYSKINFLTKHYCNTCGVLIPGDIITCGLCTTKQPPFITLKSVFGYDENSKNMIINLKFFDNLIYVKTYAKWMYNANQDMFQNADLIVPIPLHKLRLFKRKFNQSALLAQAISKLSKLPCDLFKIKRVCNTKPQSGLSLKQRQENLKKAFRVLNEKAFMNKSIVLIDDVITTGATIRSCAQEIMNSGAKEVRVLSLARTINELPNSFVV